MKHSGYLLLFFFTSFCSGLTAQDVTINVDTIKSSCDQATFKFTFTITPLPANITSILWDFDNGITVNDSTISPTVPYVHSGTYHIKLWINKTDSAEATIKIPPCLFVPNVFTPNGGNVNDQLIITYLGDGLISFKVFTRSGIMILNTEGKNITWDGQAGIRRNS